LFHTPIKPAKKEHAHQFASSVLHVLSGVPTAYGANPPCMRKSKAQMPPQVSPAKHSWLEGAPQGFAAVMGSGKPCKASKMLRHAGGTKHRFKCAQTSNKFKNRVSASLTRAGLAGFQHIFHHR
jgi:hypothetical protein